MTAGDVRSFALFRNTGAVNYRETTFDVFLSSKNEFLCVIAFMVCLTALRWYRVSRGKQQETRCRQVYPGREAAGASPLLKGAIPSGDVISEDEILQETEVTRHLHSSTYFNLLLLHLENRNLVTARALLRRMSSCHVVFSPKIQDRLVEVAVDKCKDQFFKLFSDIQACGLMPNNRNAALILKLVQQNPRSEDVEQLMMFLNGLTEYMHEHVFSSVVQACVRAERAYLLVPVLERHWEARLCPFSIAHSYASAIRAYGCLQQVNKIWATWHSMRANRIKPTSVVIGCMAEGLVANDLPDKGYEFLRELRQDEAMRPLLTSVTYCSILKGFARQKSFDKTWAVYLEMLEHRFELTIVTFNALIDACATCGEMSRVPELVESMSCQNIQPNLITYCSIVKGYCRENKLERAFELVGIMRSTTSLVPDEIMYNSLLGGCVRMRLFQRGMDVLANMESANVKPTNFTLCLLIKLAGRCCQLEKAFELFEDVSRRYHFRPNVHVFANLIQACLLHDALPRAMALVDRMAQIRMRPDCRIYRMLIRASVGSGDLESAVGLLRAAFGLSSGYSGLLGLKNAEKLMSSEVSEVLEAMASRNDQAEVKLACDLRTAMLAKH